MVVTYHIKLFRVGADRHNSILMSPLLLVVETITSTIKLKCKVRLRFNVLFKHTGWPTKMSLFFFGNNFYKNKETVKIFSPQLLEVYGIILVETNLESIMLFVSFVCGFLFACLLACLHLWLWFSTGMYVLGSLYFSCLFGLALQSGGSQGP